MAMAPDTPLSLTAAAVKVHDKHPSNRIPQVHPRFQSVIRLCHYTLGGLLTPIDSLQ